MATLSVSNNPLVSGAIGVVTVANSAQITIVAGSITQNYFGSGFTYSGATVIDGTVTSTSFYDSNNGGLQYQITGLGHSAVTVYGYVTSGNADGLRAYFLNGSDTINGSVQADLLYGYSGNDTISGSSGNDYLYGNDGSDTLNGNDGNDILDGGAGADTVAGGAGADNLRGGLDNDALDGGSDIDTAIFSGTRAQYTLDATSSGWTLSGDDGVDTLTGIEFAQFSDQTLSLGNFAPTGEVTIDGMAVQNQTLIAGNTLADTNGLGAISYQWLSSSDGTNWSLVGAGDTLALEQALIGQQIKVVASYVDGHGNTASVESAATSKVAGYQTGTAGDESLIGTNYADTLLGLDGNDTLVGGSGNDTLVGGGGDDEIILSLAGDVNGGVIDGGDGNDTITLQGPGWANLSSLDVILDQANGTISGPGFSFSVTNAENLHVIVDGFLSLADWHVSVPGNLILDAESAKMNGGSALTAGQNQMINTSGELRIGGSLSAGQGGTITIGGNLNIAESGADIHVSAPTASATVTAASLTLNGQLGFNSDYYSSSVTLTTASVVGMGEVSVTASNGGTLVLASLGDVIWPQAITLDGSLTGTSYADTLIGSASGDILVGGAGNDTVLGGEGNDLLNGGRGADRMEGGTGNDLYVVDHRFDQIAELADSGFDSVSARASHVLADNVENLYLTGSVTLRSGGLFSRKTTTIDLNSDGAGNASDNLLRGNRGHNQLDGLGGNDTMLGGAGSDVLQGGTGADRLVGGAGADVFAFAAGDGGTSLAEADMLYDFEDGIDRIALTGGLDFAELTISQGNGIDTAASNTVIGTHSEEYLVVLLNVSPGSITAADFYTLGI